MNAQDNNYGAGNWIAFIFGAVFNLLSNFDFTLLFNYALQAVVGGFIFLLFNILKEILKPLWQKYLRKISDYLNSNDESR